MLFGKQHQLAKLQLNRGDIEWVDAWPYLGVAIKSHTSFNCGIDKKVKTFYRCANGILRIKGLSDETATGSTLPSHPHYAIDVINVHRCMGGSVLGTSQPSFEAESKARPNIVA